MNENKKIVDLMLKEFGTEEEINEREIKYWFAELYPYSEMQGKYLIALALGAGMKVKLRSGQNIQPIYLSQKKITEVSKQEIEKLLEQYTKSKICEMFKCTYKTLLKVCESKGSAAAEKTRSKSFEIPTKEELLKNYMKYGTVSQLASFYNIADCTMARWLKERGINKQKVTTEIKRKMKLDKYRNLETKEISC